MRFLLFGATGMVGQGVLRECLHAADVDYVQTVGRTPTGQLDPRLHDLVHHDLTDRLPLDRSVAEHVSLVLSICWQRFLDRAPRRCRAMNDDDGHVVDS